MRFARWPLTCGVDVRLCVYARSRAPCVSYIQFKIHACIAEGSGCPFVRAGGEGQQFSIVSFCDGATCVHMPPMQSFSAAVLKSQLSRGFRWKNILGH